MKLKATLLALLLLPAGLSKTQELTDSLKQDSLIVGYNIAPPFVTEKSGHLEGPAIWLWTEISKELDLHFEYVQLPLDSLLIQLEQGTIDVCASPLTITSERSKKIDFTAPYYIAHSSLLKMNETSEEHAWDFIKSFFSLNFFRALGALAVIILIFGFLEWLFERKQNEEEFGTGLKGIWNGFWWSAVTMTTVGYGDKSPKTVGGRIVALVWMFTAIVIISGFTASIASSLTTDQISSTHSDIEDFKQLELGTVATSGSEKWLKDNFYNKRKSYVNMEEALNALKNEEIIAIAYDRPILKDIIKKDTVSEYKLLDAEFNAQYYALGMSRQLHPKLKKKINVSLLEHTETMDWKVLLTEYDLEREQ